jgi:hypothetical protein
LILRALPVPEPERLVYVAARAPQHAEDEDYLSYPLFERMRAASRDYVQLFAVTYHMRWEAAFDDARGQTEWIYPQWVSGDALAVLGVKPAVGRLLTTADDETPGQHPVAVLGHAFWTRRFGADPSVIGRWLTLRDRQYQIVGVSERGAIANVEVKGLNSRRDATQVWRRLLDGLRNRPGVEAAGISSFALFEGPWDALTVRMPGAEATAGAHHLGVSPGFFEAMSIRLLDGRDFDWRDAQPEWPSAVIVNESFAHRHFPGRSAIGQRFSAILDGVKAPIPQEIIGVVQDAKYQRVQDPTPPTVYSPRLNSRFAAVEVRTRLTESALATLVRDELPRVAPELRLIDVTRQSTLVNETMIQDRVLALLSGFFSIVAIVLVAAGLYGILSYRVVQRTREIGIRLALGSHPLAVMRLVAAEAGLVIAIGLAAGIPAGLTAARSIQSLLHGVTPSAPREPARARRVSADGVRAVRAGPDAARRPSGSAESPASGLTRRYSADGTC